MQHCDDTPSQLPPSSSAAKTVPGMFCLPAMILISDVLKSAALAASQSTPTPLPVDHAMLFNGRPVVTLSPLWARSKPEDCSADRRSNNNNNKKKKHHHNNGDNTSGSHYESPVEDHIRLISPSPQTALDAVPLPPPPIMANISRAVPSSPSRTAVVRGVAAKEVGCVLLREEQATMCCICLWSRDDERRSGQMEESVELCCGHEFHVDCLQRWLLSSRLCPMCRREL